MLRKLAILLVILVILGVLYGVGRQINDSLNAEQRLFSAQAEVEELKAENQRLTKELQRSGSIGFIERRARDKLNLTRAGETLVVIDQRLIDQIIASNSAKIEPNLPYWQGWLKTFWGDPI